MIICLQFPQHFDYPEELLLSFISRVGDIKLIEGHTVEALIPEPGSFEMEITIAKLKSLNHQVVINFRQID
jgi:hypothetical protein